ncbi:PREDICTED: protein arginine N-methyltransferase 7-like [Priapulus caudatus]|uniref:Protein arginine N-methyltransferase n=1 Tax=Priapulus caudatus TaxID=37621 RepID=A0ABM1DS22_PRICU|nr:PREDICTED: protein arginine N-methyltransferase 7-like [Priapulus caudatus]
MLHDKERNQKYYVALRKAIARMHSRGKPAHVLDIGTGTGLLSMMAVRCGADSVTACEAFAPVATCAKEVMAANGVLNKIKLISKRSTDVNVGIGCDMERHANILVTEVFDTELIGEGAIGTFHHAHKHLLEKDCIVVPSAANMYCQVVDSRLVRMWNKLEPIRVGKDVEIATPHKVAQCTGAAAVHDLQLDQLSPDQFEPITDPLLVFRFDYSGNTPILFNNHSVVDTKAKTEGSCDAVFMWWDLQMDLDGDVVLSCAPRWAHPDPDVMPWRDHWMQAVYYIPKELSVRVDSAISVHAHHDEYSLWFSVTDSSTSCESEERDQHPVCTCSAHVACSRTRIGMLNDERRRSCWTSALSKVISSDTVCLCLSDGSFLPLIAAALEAKDVFTLNESTVMRRVIVQYINTNSLTNLQILDKGPENVSAEDLGNVKVNLVIGEPFFYNSILPWDNLHFWYGLSELQHHLAPCVKILPERACIKAIAVSFEHLWKIRAPVVCAEGFDLRAFDKMIKHSAEISDSLIEPQPLWEYPGKALSEPFTVMDFDFRQAVTEQEQINSSLVVDFLVDGCCNGVALWMEYQLDDSTSISTGLTQPPTAGNLCVWDRYSQQAVHLLPIPQQVSKSSRVNVKAEFVPSQAKFSCVFSVL